MGQQYYPRFVRNLQSYPFRFVYGGNVYKIPDDNLFHGINLPKEEIEFGNYVVEISVEDAKRMPKTEFGDGIYIKSKQEEKPKGEKEMSLYNDSSGQNEGYDSFDRPEVMCYAASVGDSANSSTEAFFNSIRSQRNEPKTKGDSYMAENARENDLVLTPNEYAYVCDTNTGNVNVVVGPKKETLTNTDVPMRLDEKTGEFHRCKLGDSIRSFASANEQSYIILQNPVTKEGELLFPSEKALNKPEKLEYGRRVNINGPINFPLWPGQIAQVLSGHQLRSNQYLVVKVTNAEEATKNIQDATIQTKTEGDKEEVETKTKSKFVTGQLMIIKGTNVSFYIPPTGMEVVPDDNGNYVREALTLERLEYCVLKDENGAKRYEKGPAVVFPEPTETFIARSGGSNIFKAVELNENMGLYIKVISDYEDDASQKYKAGDELFISGKDTKIYFPRPEHAIIKYGKQIIHYAVAIPKGDARYVLDKKSGDVRLVRGPAMFLPDPRKEIIVKRVLDVRDVGLMFPGNKEAIIYNQNLAKELPHDGYIPAADVSAKRLKESAGQHSRSTMRFTDDSTLDEFADGLKRMTEYTPPRTITLENKYEGAVLINVWPGYAVQVVSKNGERKVVSGPNAILLEYDETLERLSLSTGRPKNDKNRMETVYLHVRNNKVSDVVSVTTKDLVDVDILLSYRVNFEEDNMANWFSVQDYTKFLTDHLRSIVRNAVKKYGIEEFNEKAIDIVRDTILGTSSDKQGKREGRFFEENGMHVYDVEVLEVSINDASIRRLLVDNQHKTVQEAIQLLQTKKRLEITKETQEAERQIFHEKSLTDLKTLELQAEILKKKTERDNVETNARVEIQPLLDAIAKAELDRKKAEDKRKIDRVKEQSEIITKAHEKRMAAISPDLVAAINSLGDKQLAQALVENLPKATGDSGAIFGIGALKNVIQMVAGTKMEKTLRDIASKVESVDIDPDKTPRYNEED